MGRRPAPALIALTWLSKLLLAATLSTNIAAGGLGQALDAAASVADST